MNKTNIDRTIDDALEREESASEFLKRAVSDGNDLRDAISFLIHRRELLRDCEIERLEHACDGLLRRLAELKQAALVEELSCFKDVLALHRKLAANDGAHRR